MSLARAFLKDAPILVLDEATASLDMKSEELIQKEIEKLASGRTTFIIAHRFSTIRMADRILVLEGGRIAAWTARMRNSWKNLPCTGIFTPSSK